MTRLPSVRPRTNSQAKTLSSHLTSARTLKGLQYIAAAARYARGLDLAPGLLLATFLVATLNGSVGRGLGDEIVSAFPSVTSLTTG